jgi:hypothetical protein
MTAPTQRRLKRVAADVRSVPWIFSAFSRFAGDRNADASSMIHAMTFRPS